ncbi:MAG: copper chaperone PCu(A)C [Gammaproteobacteria bacterium]
MKRRTSFLILIVSLLMPAFAWAEYGVAEGSEEEECPYLANNKVVFSDIYARLVNRGPNMLAVYGKVKNNDDEPHVLTDVSAPNAKLSNFQEYRQDGGAGPITAHPLSNITLDKEGGFYVWEMGGNHITLAGFDKKTAGEKLQFGTTFDPNQTIDLTFTFADGCKKTVYKVPIRDRMQD